MHTVPEGQSVGNFEPTPRTYYLTPRGENYIFGELSMSWMFLRRDICAKNGSA